MKPQHLILILMLTVSCTETENQPVSAENTDSLLFQEFLGLIPDTTLPIEIYCGFDHVNRIDNRSKYSKYMYNFIQPVARLKWNNGINIVFYAAEAEIYVPILCTYDESGKMIDSITIHTHGCNYSPEFEGISFAAINQEMEISLSDTEKVYIYNENTPYVDPILDSIKIIEIKYKLNPVGKLEMIKKGTRVFDY